MRFRGPTFPPLLLVSIDHNETGLRSLEEAPSCARPRIIGKTHLFPYTKYVAKYILLAMDGNVRSVGYSYLCVNGPCISVEYMYTSADFLSLVVTDRLQYFLRQVVCSYFFSLAKSHRILACLRLKSNQILACLRSKRHRILVCLRYIPTSKRAGRDRFPTLMILILQGRHNSSDLCDLAHMLPGGGRIIRMIYGSHASWVGSVL